MSSLDITHPISWKNPAAGVGHLLATLQANILKGHGRDHAKLCFLTFKPGADAARTALSKLGLEVTSAQQQLQDTQTFKDTGKTGPPVVLFFLTASGYNQLNAADKMPAVASPADPFLQGMVASAPSLGDDTTLWEAPFTQDMHAMVLVADDKEALVDARMEELMDEKGRVGLRSVANVVFTQRGAANRNKHGEGIEHFGYMDGRSQPLMLVEDIDDERTFLRRDHATMDGRENTRSGHDWAPNFGPDLVLVREPDGVNFGSFFVFRKLEQNVRDFKQREQDLATAMGLVGDARELAGALAVGRFEDGTPVVLSDTDGLLAMNAFDYSNDTNAARCPFHAHIRKVNPRGETHDAGERRHIMARRGITYGSRLTHPDAPELDSDPALYPTGDVGLLFMAYNGSISNQFEFTQRSWANNDGFVRPNTGIDPVIGQGPASRGHDWRVSYDDPASATVPFDFAGFVTTRGGGYFFAPSLPTLRSLAD